MQPGDAMRRLGGLILLAIGLGAGAAGGYWYARLPAGVPTAAVAPESAAAAGERKILYYRDPSGAPIWSAEPKKDAGGRDYLPVFEDEEISFQPERKTPTAMAGGPRKIRYYRNPMGLPDTSPVPKKDSMGMDYIAVYDGEDSEDGAVKLSPGKIQRTGAKSEPVARQVVRSIIRASGTVAEDERRISVVALRFEGFVESVANVTTGEHIHKGQVLMNVYSPALSAAAAEYLSAINAGTTGQALKGARRRLENLNAPEPAIKELERTREISLSIPWLAPQDGEILERNAVPGMRAGPGAVLFRIADHRLVWVLLDVAERDLGKVGVGTKVTIRPRALPGETFAGAVALIYPHLNAQTRTARIRIEVPNPEEALRPEMYVDAEIESGTPGPVLAVPESAVLDSGTRQALLIDKGDGRFEPREVKLGRHGGGYVEIVDGVSEGEAVVTAANFLIDAESNLKAALKGFAEGGSAPASEPVHDHGAHK
jgi:Cu(I)/Ag(I) efflux system membrane fusion protein